MKEREKSELGQSRGPAKAGPPRKRSGPPALRSVNAKSEAIVRQVNPDFVAGGLIGPIMQKAPMVAAIMLSAIVFFSQTVMLEQDTRFWSFVLLSPGQE